MHRRGITGIGLVGILLGASLGASAPATQAQAAGSTSAVLDCGSAYDVFQAPDVAASSCGITETPATSTTTLPDGGTSTTYKTATGTWTVNVPPAGFDAAAASASELQEYGIPSEPPASQTDAVASWKAMVQNMHFVPATPFWATTHTTAGGTESYANSANWAGYVDINQTFNLSETIYTEPHLGSSRCSSNSVVFWTGLGGWYSQYLEQNGTGENTPGLGQDQGWVADSTGSIQPVNIYASEGYNFTVETTYQGSNVFNFFFYNAHTGATKSANLTTSTSQNSRTTSESIVERPTYNGSYTNLSNFGTMQFPLAVANGQAPINSSNYIQVTMVNPSDNYTLATVGQLGSGGNSFSATQKSCN